jgi:hypothetical protein
MPRCSVCSRETDLYLDGVPICLNCDQARVDKEARSFPESSEALVLGRIEYCEALAAHEDVRYMCSALDPGNPYSTTLLRHADARVEAACSAYENALRDFDAFTRG